MSTTTANGRKPRGTKATAAKAAIAPVDSAETKPRDDVTLDLDTLEREDKREPFTFLHDGHVYEVMDPQEMDWQEALRGFGDPIYFLQHAMSAEDVAKFFKTKTPSWKLNKIMERYQAHFGLPSPGEAVGSLI